VGRRRMGVNLCVAASLSLRLGSLTDSRLAQPAVWPQRKRMGSRVAAPCVARVAARAARPRPVRVLMYVAHPYDTALVLDDDASRVEPSDWRGEGDGCKIVPMTTARTRRFWPRSLTTCAPCWGTPSPRSLHTQIHIHDAPSRCDRRIPAKSSV
jgi:hypothetical protein